MAISVNLIVPQTRKAARLSESSCESYIGGCPRLPVEMPLPTCGLCGSLQTFYFQVAFPDDHIWKDQSLAVFQCTSCYNPEYDIAPILTEDLLPPEFKGFSWDRIPRDFPHALLEYIQINWKVIVFPTAEGTPRQDYPARIQFIPLRIKPSLELRPSMKSRIGGEPGWSQGDERPLTCDRVPMQFLMQWRSFFDFPIVPGAPPQHDRAFTIAPAVKEGQPYHLLIGMFLYFFGCTINNTKHILIWPQRY
jgi:hypothetical protein